MMNQSTKDSYLSGNRAHYEKGYYAPHVDHYVFRFYGRILKVDFPHLAGCKLIDFGCGQGAAVNFFSQLGFDAIGVDISNVDIAAAKQRFPHDADRFRIIDPDPRVNDSYGFSDMVGVVTAFQSLYFLNNTDMDLCIERLYRSMQRGGVFFATMVMPSGQYWEGSTPTADGMRTISFNSKRLSVENLSINFTNDETHLKRRFHRFTPVHIGHYSANYRSDETGTSHLTFCGIKD